MALLATSPTNALADRYQGAIPMCPKELRHQIGLAASDSMADPSLISDLLASLTVSPQAWLKASGGTSVRGSEGPSQRTRGWPWLTECRPSTCKRVAAGAQADGAMVVTHGIARRSADLREGRSGFRNLDAVDHQAGAIARHQVKGVAAIGRNVDEAVP